MPTTSERRLPPLITGAMAAKPAPILPRALAMVLDSLLGITAAMTLLKLVVFPLEIPNAQDIMVNQLNAFYAAADQVRQTGQVPELVLSEDYEKVFDLTVKTGFGVLLLYFAGSEMGMRGSTLGKKVFALRTARWGDSSVPNPMEILMRNMIKAITVVSFPILTLVDIIPMMFSPSRRCLHDYLARTIVTRGSPPPEPEETQPPLMMDDD